MAKFYAVKEGKKPGIYMSWDECKEQVNGYSGAVYKSFTNEEEAKAFIKKEISSAIGLRGIARKSLILIVLIVAVLLDRLINNETWLFRTVVCYFYIANEAISLLENAAGMGLTIPAQLQEALIQLKSGNKKEINKDAQ